MLTATLSFVVGAVTMAVGWNLIRTATETADLEGDLTGAGERSRSMRRWNLRIGGVLLLCFGLAIVVLGVASA